MYAVSVKTEEVVIICRADRKQQNVLTGLSATYERTVFICPANLDDQVISMASAVCLCSVTALPFEPLSVQFTEPMHIGCLQKLIKR